jgi:osmotically-inducible protein OsmY
MTDGRRDQDWRWRGGGNRQGDGEFDRRNYGSRGSGYPDDTEAGYGRTQYRGDGDGEAWDDGGRISFERSYRGRIGGYTTDPDPPSQAGYRDSVGRGGYGGRERNWADKTSDEISAWFGDDDAARRRDLDRRRGGHYGRGPRGYQRSDERIAEDVNDRLTDDWRLDASEITVSVNNREVTLSGTVLSREDKHRAEDLADDVSGVTYVQNNLRIQPPSGPPAGQIGGSITGGGG